MDKQLEGKLKVRSFEITSDQLRELVLDFWDKIQAVKVDGEEDHEHFTAKKAALEEPLRDLLYEIWINGPYTKAKFTLEGRV